MKLDAVPAWYPREVLRGERPKWLFVHFGQSKWTPAERPRQAGKPEPEILKKVNPSDPACPSRISRDIAKETTGRASHGPYHSNTGSAANTPGGSHPKPDFRRRERRFSMVGPGNGSVYYQRSQHEL